MESSSESKFGDIGSDIAVLLITLAQLIFFVFFLPTTTITSSATLFETKRNPIVPFSHTDEHIGFPENPIIRLF